MSAVSGIAGVAGGGLPVEMYECGLRNGSPLKWDSRCSCHCLCCGNRRSLRKRSGLGPVFGAEAAGER